MRIALLDDDDAQIRQVGATLAMPLDIGADENFLSTFSSGEALRRALRTETFDVLILDWLVPDLDGIALLKWLRREREDKTPVIMLSQKTAERDVAHALSHGADDYILKPFRPLELRARILRLFERHSETARKGPISQFDGWEFNSLENTVIYKSDPADEGEQTHLTEREFKFALALFRNLDRTISRTHLLLAAGYHSDESLSRSLDIHIYRIRKKLSLNGDRGMQIKTVYGQGYRLAMGQTPRSPPI